MIFADKLIRLRKKNGWPQEELAEKLNVSRQAVSKWEGAQNVPELEKLLQMSTLFGVTTDYLLKDELELEEYTPGGGEAAVKRITLRQAQEFLQWRKKAAVFIAAGVFLCIASIIPLLMLGAASDAGVAGVTEEIAGAAGLCAMVVLVAAGVSLFVWCGFKNAPYEFIDSEPFETEYGVHGMVTEKKKNYRGTYAACNIVATCICILSIIPLFLSILLKGDLLPTVLLLCLTILLAGLGVVLFILCGVRWASMAKLLQEADYAYCEKEKKRRERGCCPGLLVPCRSDLSRLEFPDRALGHHLGSLAAGRRAVCRAEQHSSADRLAQRGFKFLNFHIFPSVRISF